MFNGYLRVIPIPLYRLFSGICLEICCTCNRNLTRSIGATTVFDTAAETPPAMKFFSESYGSDSPDIVQILTRFISSYLIAHFVVSIRCL